MRTIEETRALSTIDPELDHVRIIHMSKDKDNLQGISC